MAKATRQAFGETIARLGEKFPEIVVLDADLSKSTKSDLFQKKFPDRFFEMGIAEANMIGTAAGLSLAGKMPFLCSFGCFLTGRYDTIRISISYARANVRLVGTHAGVGIGDDGHSQMGLEDVALMRALPEMGVFQPMDARETELVIEYLVTQWKGPAYLRLTRQNLPDLFPKDGVFVPTKIMKLNQAEKAEVALVATGATVAEALCASEQLKAKGIAASVHAVHCLKPFDEEAISKIADQVKLIVSVEDHSVIGGLGSCVAEALVKKAKHAPLKMLGIQDTFGESGEQAELYDKHGISAAAICEQTCRALKEQR